MGQKKAARRRLLFVSGNIYAFGGAEVHGIRALDLLQRAYDVTLVHTGGPLDSAQIEAWTDRKLDPAHVRFLTAPHPQMPSSLGNWALIHFAFALREARRLAPNYDLLLSFFGECPIRHPRVLQFVQYPQFFWDKESLAHLGVAYDNPIKHQLRALYVMAARAIAGWNRDDAMHAQTLVNSDWSNDQFSRLYPGAEAQTLYPGIITTLKPEHAAYLPFADRANGFVVIGRVVPSKRIDMAVEIISGLRARGHNLELHIIGRANEPYASEVRRLLADKPWAHWHQGLPRRELEALAASMKWGIHCYQNEHYGAAPGELQALGCITFVHDSGGQKEIVRNPDLRYTDTQNAIEKIERVLNDPASHPRLLTEIAQSNQMHKFETFDDKFLKIVDKILSDPTSNAGCST